ncbi:MAG: SurA N-terminal domain-containing protein [Bacteroidales bacterium]|nr:SurA N-terminal domain-containing protein [Bacteroidales bacterium]
MAIIGKIRKRAGIAVGLIALAIVAFILSDLLGGRQGNVPSVLATINGTDISFAEYEKAVANTENNLKQQYGTANISQEQSFAAKQQAYQSLLSQKLLHQECSKLGISVSEEEMNDMFFGDFIPMMVRQNFSDPQTGQYNAQAIKQYIAQFDKLPEDQKASWTDFERSVKESRLQEKYNSIVASSFYMPKAIAAHMSEVSNNVTDSRYAVLSYQSVADNTIKVTEEDYKKYYEEHKNEFKLYDEIRELEFVKFSVLPSAADVKAINDSVVKTFADFQAISNEEVPSFVSISSDRIYDSTYYKVEDLKTVFADSVLANKKTGDFIAPFQQGSNWIMAKITDMQARPDSVRFSQILILNSNASKEIKRTPEQAKNITDSLFNVFKKNSEVFEQNVAKYSDDPEAKNNFGDSDWILDGQLPSELYELVKATNVKDVFVYNLPNEMGHYLIKVTNKTEAKTKMQIAMIVMGVRASDKTINETKDKADVFLGASKTLTDMKAQAQKDNINILTSQIDNMTYQLNGTPYCREIIRWAFNEETKVGDVAPEVYQLQDMFLVVGLKDVKGKGILSFEQAKPYIESQVKNEKKAQILMEKAEKLQASNKTLETFAAAASVQIDSAMAVDFASPYFAGAGPEMRVIGQLSSVKQAGLQKPVRGFNGVYVVNVDRVYTRPAKEDVKLIQQQYKTKALQKTQMLLQVLQRKANITNNFAIFY